MPPPKPPKPPPAVDEDASEPNPPTFAAVPNPLEAPNVPVDPPPPKGELPPEIPVVFPIPSDPKDGVVVDVAVVGCGCGVPTPNMDGSRLYLRARLRNSCSSFPAYFCKILSTPLSLDGSLVW